MEEKQGRKAVRKACKKRARGAFKRHYLLFVVVCLIAAIMGAEFTESLMLFQAERTVVETDEGGELRTSFKLSADDVFDWLLEGETEIGQVISDFLNEEKQSEEKKIGIVSVGYAQGVLASLVRSATSGKFLITLMTGLQTVFGSQTAGIVCFGLLFVLITIALWAFIQNLYGVVARRIFLESRVYKYVPMKRFLYLIRVKKWCRSAWTMFVAKLYSFLWMLTIIGGIIKHYSYKMVPFIVAENPTVTAKQAITLSRKMMNGHKWELFVYDLSMLGWSVLEILTGGLLGLFFLNPYKLAIEGEYYSKLREMAIENKLEGSELFNDSALFAMPNAETLERAYSDVVKLRENEPIMPTYSNAFTKFLGTVFGIIPNYNVKELFYRKSIQEQSVISEAKHTLNGETYPERLYPIPREKRGKSTENLMPLRRYSLPSIIMMFFAFAFVGWLWEVSLHIVEFGKFHNRGTLHGPWLPIYGAGCVMILIVLYRLRKNVLVELLAAIVLCGVVEYFTSWYLEVTKDGVKWWDYTGYFLNINGRVCAEGLLVFGFGGIAVVYIVAPLIDNLLAKINPRWIAVAAIVLLAIFLGDVVYSHFHPNQGEGITDYATSATVTQAEAETGTEAEIETQAAVN